MRLFILILKIIQFCEKYKEVSNSSYEILKEQKKITKKLTAITSLKYECNLAKVSS